jgi:hypothetical protein
MADQLTEEQIAEFKESTRALSFMSFIFSSVRFLIV